MKGLEVRPSLSLRLFPLCVLGVLLASVQLAGGSASDTPQAGPGRPTPSVSPSVGGPGDRRMRGLPLLRRAEQVRQLTTKQANLGYPVHLRAVVTYFNPGEGDLFVQDSSAGVWVDIGPRKLSVRPGLRVDLEGISEGKGFAPQVGQPRLRVLGEGKLPKPRRVSYESMISTQEDSQWVEVEGVIHSASSAEGYLDLDLAMVGGRVKVRIPDFWRPVPARLVDARLRIRGVCGAEYNPSKQIVGVMVYVPSLAFVEVVEQPPADPYDLPLRSIGSLLRFSPQRRFGHRVRVQGVVTLARQGRSFFVQDKSDTAYVQAAQRVSVQPEDRVDVLGFPAVGQQAPMLLDAVVRTVGHEAIPRPALVTPSGVLRGPYDGHLVRLEARLLDKVLGPREQLLLLQADDQLFNAQLEDPRAIQSFSALAKQSLVQVTGICAVEEDEDRQPRAFRVLLRSAEDVVVVERPPWLSLRDALLGLGVMAALILGALGWAVLLRQRVSEQTALIREQLRREAALKGQYRDLFEKANDIIYTLDLAGDVTALNAAGEEATGYSRQEALRMNAAEIVAPELGARLAETLKRVQEGEPVPTEEWELITKDGHRLSVEVSTRLILEDGKPVGVQGIARDVTERKRAEDQLRKLSRAVEQSPASVIITDVRGNIEYVNPKFTELTGYTLEEVVGKNPRILKSAEHPVEMYEQLWQAITSGGEWRGEFHNKKKSGELYWESAVISAVRNGQGAITHFLAVKEDITGRKRSEEALRTSEERSRIVAASISDLIYEWDLKDRVDWYGDVDSLMGYPAGGFPRTLNGWAAALHPEDKERVWVAVENQLKGAAPYDFEEYRIGEKDGGWRWWSARGTVLRDEQGQPRSWIGAVTDITERKRAEEILRESEEKFRGLFQGAAEGILVSNIETKKFLYANPAVCRMLGYTEEELVHLGVSDIHPQQDLEWVVAEFMAQVRGEKTLAPALPCLRKDGTTIYADVNASRLVVDGKDCNVGFFTDITARKRAEEVAREAHEALRTLLQASPMAILAFNAHASVAEWNPAAEHLFGWTASEVMGRPIPIVIEEEREHFRARFAKEQRGEECGNIEVRALRKDGTAVDILLSSAPRHDGRGNLIGSIAVIADISDRKGAEAELRKAKDAAEAATRAKSEFLANMSHEIRTPMNGIIGMTELALDTELTPEQRDCLVMVRESADALLTIINDILDFSRIEAGKLGLDLSEFDLTELVGSTLKGLAVRAHQKGLELAFHIAPELPALLVGDAGRLRQVLVNLIGNAIKFTEKGEVALTVEAESPVDNAVLVRFRVADTGIGVPESQRTKIFEAFAQGDSSTTRKYGGTGLGLSISSRLVEMMGGRIWVESEVGRGSAFNFTARLGLHAPQPPNDLPEELASLRALPVLVVDDNATSRRVLAATLQQWGMKTTLAESGPAALAAAARAKEVGNEFPCVVIDAQMPGMDGFMLAQRILAIGDSGLGVGRNPNPEPRNPSQCGIIMMLTSTHQRDDAACCRELGIVTYLVKPILPRELLAALLAALGTRGVEFSVSPSVDESGDQRMAGVTRPSGDTPGADHRNLRVLVVEDSAVNRQLIVRLLEKRGHTSEIAANGREALAILERAGLGSFDLVLMDVQMPEMDGFEATAAIREWEKAGGTHLPIIALTAYALQGDLERCLAAGMDGYIPKPVRAGELFAAVEGLLGFAAEAAAGAQEGRRGRGRSAE